MATASSDSLEADAPKKGAAAGPKGAARELIELVKTVTYALLIALVLRVLLFQPFTIPSASMEPTLLEGDYIIVSKFAYGWSKNSIPLSPPLFHGRILQHGPHRGDIVVFKLPRDGHTDYIKRLIGLPGDKIQVKHGVLNINDRPVNDVKLASANEDSAFGVREVDRYKETLGDKTFITNTYGPDGPADNTGVYVVPKGCYFMMGDNRDNSLDSRFPPYNDPNSYAAKTCPWDNSLDQYVGQPYAGPGFVPDNAGVGFVPAENLIGKADVILFSWKPGASIFKPWTWFTDARWDRFVHFLT